MANRIWRFLCERVEREAGYQVHPGPGAAPSQDDVSGRIHHVVAEAWRSVRGTLPLAIILTPASQASPRTAIGPHGLRRGLRYLARYAGYRRKTERSRL